MALSAPGRRQLARKLESLFSELVVESFAGRNGHEITIAVVVRDPEFNNDGILSRSAPVRVHAANLVVHIPHQFPAHQAVVSVHRIRETPFEPHPLLRPSADPNVFHVDHQEVEYRVRPHDPATSLVNFVEALIRALCVGPDPLVIPEFFEFWRASGQSSRVKRGRTVARGDPPSASTPSKSSSASFPGTTHCSLARDGSNALHKAATYGTLYPADLEKLATTFICGGKMGLRFKHGSAFEYYGAMRGFSSTSAGSDKLRKEEAAASLMLFRLQMTWAKATRKCMEPNEQLSELPADARSSRKCWVCSPAAYFWHQHERQTHVAADGRQSMAQNTRAKQARLDETVSRSSNGTAASKSSQPLHDDSPALARKLSASGDRSARSRDSSTTDPTAPLFQQLVNSYSLDLEATATPWELVKCGVVSKRRSSHRLSSWKKRILFVVTFDPARVANSHTTDANLGNVPVHSKVVFFITRPLAKGQDRSQQSLTKLQWPQGHSLQRQLQKQSIKADIFDPPRKSSCCQVYVNDKTHQHVFRVSSRHSHDRDFAVRSLEELDEWLDTIHSTVAECSFAHRCSPIDRFGSNASATTCTDADRRNKLVSQGDIWNWHDDIHQWDIDKAISTLSRDRPYLEYVGLLPPASRSAKKRSSKRNARLAQLHMWLPENRPDIETERRTPRQAASSESDTVPIARQRSHSGIHASNPQLFNLVPYEVVASKLVTLLRAALLPFVAAQQLYALVRIHGHVRYVPVREYLRKVRLKLGMDIDSFRKGGDDGGADDSSSSHLSGNFSSAPGTTPNRVFKSPKSWVLGFLQVVRAIVRQRTADCGLIVKNAWLGILAEQAQCGTPRTPNESHSRSAVQFVAQQQLLNQRDAMGRTPFFEACATGNLAAVKYFCRMGADVSIPDSGNILPLEAAQNNQQLEIVLWLLEMYSNDFSGQDSLAASFHTHLPSDSSNSSESAEDLEASIPLDRVTEGDAPVTPARTVQSKGRRRREIPPITVDSPRGAPPSGSDNAGGGGGSKERLLSLRAGNSLSPAILRASSLRLVLGNQAGHPQRPASRDLFTKHPSVTASPSLLHRTLNVLQVAQSSLCAALQTSAGKLVMRQQQKSFAGNVDQSYNYLLRLLVEELKARQAVTERRHQAYIFAELELELVMTMILHSHRETICAQYFFTAQILEPATRAKISRYFGELLRLQRMIIDMRQQLINDILGWLDAQRLFLKNYAIGKAALDSPQIARLRTAKDAAMLACVQHMVLLHGLEHGQEQQRLCWTIMRSVSTKKQEAFRQVMLFHGIDSGDAFVHLYRPPRSIIDGTVAVRELMNCLDRVATVAARMDRTESDRATSHLDTARRTPLNHGRAAAPGPEADLRQNLSVLLQKMHGFEQNGSGAAGVLITAGSRKSGSVLDFFRSHKRKNSPLQLLGTLHGLQQTMIEPPSPSKTSAEKDWSPPQDPSTSTKSVAAVRAGAPAVLSSSGVNGVVLTPTRMDDDQRWMWQPPGKSTDVNDARGRVVFDDGKAQSAIEMSPSLFVPDAVHGAGGGGNGGAPYVPTLRRRMTLHVPAQARRFSLVDGVYHLKDTVVVPQDESPTDQSEFSDTSTSSLAGDDDSAAAVVMALAAAAGAGARRESPLPSSTPYTPRIPTSTSAAAPIAQQVSSNTESVETTYRHQRSTPPWSTSKGLDHKHENRGIPYFKDVPPDAFHSVQIDRLGPQLAVRCTGAQLFHQVRRRHSGSLRSADIACVLTLAGAPLITSFVRAGILGTKWGRKCVWQLREPVASLYLTIKIVLRVPQAHEGNDGESVVLGQCIIPILSLLDHDSCSRSWSGISRVVQKRLWFSLYAPDHKDGATMDDLRIRRSQSALSGVQGAPPARSALPTPANDVEKPLDQTRFSRSSHLRSHSSKLSLTSPAASPSETSIVTKTPSPGQAGAIWLDITLDLDGLYRNEELFVPALELQRLCFPNVVSAIDTTHTASSTWSSTTKRFKFRSLDDMLCWQFKFQAVSAHSTKASISAHDSAHDSQQRDQSSSVHHSPSRSRSTLVEGVDFEVILRPQTEKVRQLLVKLLGQNYDGCFDNFVPLVDDELEPRSSSRNGIGIHSDGNGSQPASRAQAAPAATAECFEHSKDLDAETPPARGRSDQRHGSTPQPIIIRFVANCVEDWGKFCLRDAFEVAAQASDSILSGTQLQSAARERRAALAEISEFTSTHGIRGSLRWSLRPAHLSSSRKSAPTHVPELAIDVKTGVMSSAVRRTCAADLRRRHVQDVPFLCSPHVFARQYYFRAAGTYKVWRTSMPTEAIHLWQPRTVKSSLRTLRSRVPLAPGDKVVFQFKVWSVGVAGIVIGVGHKDIDVEQCIGLASSKIKSKPRRARPRKPSSDARASPDDGDVDLSEEEISSSGKDTGDNTFDSILSMAQTSPFSRPVAKTCRSWGYSSDGLLLSDGHFRFGGIEYEAGAFLQLHVDVPSAEEPRGRMMLRDSHGNVSDNMFDDLCLGPDSDGTGQLYIAVSLSEGAEVWLKNTNEQRDLRSASSAALLQQQFGSVRNDIILADEKLQRDIRDKLSRTITRSEYLTVLGGYTRELSALSLPVRDAVSAAQVRRDLCREKLWINGEEYEEHLADAGGLAALRTCLHATLENFNVGVSTWVEEGGADIDTIIAWILQACSRTLSGGDAYFALFSILPCDHMTPSHLKEHKDTEIFISAENIIVKTNNVFDLLIQQTDDTGVGGRGRGLSFSPSAPSGHNEDAGDEVKREIVVSTLILEQLPLRVEAAQVPGPRNDAHRSRNIPPPSPAIDTLPETSSTIHINSRVSIQSGGGIRGIIGTVVKINNDHAKVELDWVMADGRPALAFASTASLTPVDLHDAGHEDSFASRPGDISQTEPNLQDQLNNEDATVEQDGSTAATRRSKANDTRKTSRMSSRLNLPPVSLVPITTRAIVAQPRIFSVSFEDPYASLMHENITCDEPPLLGHIRLQRRLVKDRLFSQLVKDRTSFSLHPRTGIPSDQPVHSDWSKRHKAVAKAFVALASHAEHNTVAVGLFQKLQKFHGAYLQALQQLQIKSVPPSGLLDSGQLLTLPLADAAASTPHYLKFKVLADACLVHVLVPASIKLVDLSKQGTSRQAVKSINRLPAPQWLYSRPRVENDNLCHKVQGSREASSVTATAVVNGKLSVEVVFDIWEMDIQRKKGDDVVLGGPASLCAYALVVTEMAD